MTSVELLQAAEPVIACTLGGGDFKARVAWIAKLNTASLHSHQREDLVLRLIYGPEAREQVRLLVAQEQACCAFLSFDLEETPERLTLKITAPEAARGAADDVFAPFIPTVPTPVAAGCGCCGGAGA